MGLDDVKHVLLVLSGKGGVGKSSVSVQTTLGLLARGMRVGILDIDLCGPSIPKMLGVEKEVAHTSDAGLVPVMLMEGRLKIMSMGLLAGISEDDAVVWRGPKKQSMISQLIKEVTWDELDVLVIDTPPGTSDEHLSMVKTLREVSVMEKTHAILVTTPQMASLQDVGREINFCQKTKISMLGLVENMSGFVCPNCSECSNLFNSGGGKKLAEKFDIEFMGAIPIDPNFGLSLDKGCDFVAEFKTTATAQAIGDIVDKVRVKLQ